MKQYNTTTNQSKKGSLIPLDSVHTDDQTKSNHEESQLVPDQVDSASIIGLRGFLSIYIMMYHSLLYSEWEINLLGGVPMTFFFILSGFVLGLRYGRTQYLPTPCCSELCPKPDNESSHFDSIYFYRRRMARILPLFYLTNLICIPLVFSGHAWINLYPDYLQYPCYVLTLFIATSWLGPSLTLNGPSWFVSTICFFYWIFPSILPRLQRYTTKQKQRYIIIYYILQIMLFMAVGVSTTFVLYHRPIPQNVDETIGFFVSTTWPPSRLPLFIMGILGGLLRTENIGILPNVNIKNPSSSSWRKCSDLLCVFLIFQQMALVMIENAVTFIGSDGWMQVVIACIALQFIVSLTFDKGTSQISKLLTSNVMLGFGKISYALYLIHEPLIQYFCWIYHGQIGYRYSECETLEERECDEEFDSAWKKRLIPIWGIPIIWIVSVVMAVVLNRVVEEPFRKMMSPPRKCMKTELPAY